MQQTVPRDGPLEWNGQREGGTYRRSSKEVRGKVEYRDAWHLVICTFKFLSIYIYSKGAWKCIFPTFLGNYGRQTNQSTNHPTYQPTKPTTDMRGHV